MLIEALQRCTNMWKRLTLQLFLLFIIFLGGVNDTLRVFDGLADCCKKAHLQHPERVTSTNLRKFMAKLLGF